MTATAAVVVALTLLVAGVALVALVRWSLIRAIDQAAHDQVTAVTSAIAAGQLGATVPSGRSATTLVQVVDASNTVQAATSNIQGEPPILPTVPVGGQRFVTRSNLPLGPGAFRVLIAPVRLHGQTGHIYIATSLTQVNAATTNTAILFGAGLPITVALLSWVVWRSATRALRPVDRIREHTALIQAETITARVPVPDTDDEISRLALTMNQMLDRLERSSRQQAEFVGNASHELKSPLAALRTHLEVALDEESDAARREVLTIADEQVQRMAELIEDLLFLAREREQLNGVASWVDLDEIVLAEATRLRRFGRVDIITHHLDATRIHGSGRSLARMLANVGDNAMHFARTAVMIDLRSGGGQAVITITDDGPGIPPSEREHVFQRFARLDTARTRPGNSPGTGLGLAIARQIAQDHGGVISIDDRADQRPGAVVKISLPSPEHATTPMVAAPADSESAR
ncbi:HAMP domain-containing sensor histidine kinase [Curtobacterium ammoniigenes]|uniref:HAMP domain-containing sensor histidine kinase n=1 Tax=Curtobacterium ammoniigenes TaxID=395387 RepID=UPI00146FF5E0|nr:HAMP domain-containing sensor histidine kinase [Curtobacterium ammoniigenes]